MGFFSVFVFEIKIETNALDLHLKDTHKNTNAGCPHDIINLHDIAGAGECCDGVMARQRDRNML